MAEKDVKITEEKTYDERAERREFFRKISRIQGEIKVPKGQRNNFGKYNFRNLEDILDVVKPLLAREELCLFMSDEVKYDNGRFYVEATVTITDGINKVVATAPCREENEKKGMDGSQITGAASSYARKMALGGLLEVSGSKDMDTYNNGYNNPHYGNNNLRPAQPPARPTYNPQPAVQTQSAPQPVENPVMTILKNVAAKAKEKNIPKEDITMVIQTQFGKTSRELTLEQAKLLEMNFENYLDAYKKQKVSS